MRHVDNGALGPLGAVMMGATTGGVRRHLLSIPENDLTRELKMSAG